MYYAIRIELFDVYDTWHLIPTKRPAIAPPTKKQNSVDIPGASSHLDLSNAITGYPTYENRTGSIEFMIEPDHKESWQEIYSDIMQKLSYLDEVYEGKIPTVMEEDPGWEYTGLWTVNQFQSDKNYSTITLDYDLYPYKKRIGHVLNEWPWDSMNFDNGILYTREVPGYHYGFSKIIDTDVWEEDSMFFNITPFSVDERIELLGVEPLSPTFSITGGPITVEIKNSLSSNGTITATLTEGLHQISDFILYPTPGLTIRAIGHGTMAMIFTPGGI